MRNIAIALSIFAALRILAFALAFPLFNNVDEKLHFLTIQMYAQGHLPGKDLPPTPREFVKTFLPYWSPEYMSRPEFITQNESLPPYQMSPEARDATLARGIYAWKLQDVPQRPNFEAQGAPLYYLIAAPWYKLGATFGLSDWRLAYWLRMLNPISYGLLVWLSYRFVSRVYPKRYFLRLAVPALLAVFPQDVFFGMNRDVFNPTFWAAALLLMVGALDDEKDRYRSLLLAALLVGLSLLIEVSSCVLYGALAITFWIWAHRSPRAVQQKIAIAAGGATAAFVPPALWMLRNYLVIGNLTGTKAKMAALGWTVKPFAQVWHHPVFTWHGLSYYLPKLTLGVWHGDYDWYGQPMRSPAVDWFYVLSSFLTILVFSIAFARGWKRLPDLKRWFGFLTIFLVFGSFLFLTATAMALDYPSYSYPNPAHPFFISGRIISGGLLPFALIYAGGLELITTSFRKWISPATVLVCLLLLITASEIWVRRGAFGSPYNFFAISRWQRSSGK
jgi:hypothetical protein